jgi:SAM-dependent methyltransferase
MSENWYQEWFDSPLYYEIYAARDESDAHKLLALVLKHIPNPPAKVLDLACGRGRHAISLAEKGFTVTGIDLSASALEHARKNAIARRVNINFIRADIRDPINGTFDAVINCFTSFGYFKDVNENLLVLENVVSALAPCGVFVIDFLNADFVRKNLVPTETGTFSNGTYTIRRVISEPFVEKEIKFLNADGTIRSFTEQVHLLPATWFQQVLKDLGCVEIASYGSYEGEPYNAVCSPRYIGIFQNRKTD